MAAPDYRTSTTALVNALKTLFENRTCTEAQAIAYASTKPNTVFYTSDTHNIVVGGIVYGRSEQITANAFAYLPASELDPSDPAFSDTSKIYIQPTSTAGVMKLWWYYNGTWINSDSQAMSVPISAEDITYDLTNTPDLGEGDVQSAIEAVDGKVEQLSLDTMGKDESGEYWEDLLFEKHGYSAISANNRRIGANHATTTDSSGVGRKIYIFPASEGDVFKVTGAAGSGDWTGFWKGGTAYSSITATNYLSSATVASGTYTAPANATLFAFVSIDARFTSDTAHVWKKTTRTSKTPADIQRQLIEGWTPSVINTSALEVGDLMPYWAAATTYHGIRVEVKKGQVLLLDLQGSSTYAPLVFTDYGRVITEIHQSPVYGAFEAPNDGYAYLQKLISHESDNYLYIMGYGGHAKDMADNRVGRDELQAQFDALYQKGVADGSAMASIVGLGYNVWDYITGAVNMAGFEYGCNYMRNSIITPLTGTLKQRYNSNKNFVYFPKVDVSGLTPDGEYAFAECSNLVLIPDMNYRVGTEGDCYRMFDNCKKLKHVGSFGNMQPTRLNYMFSGCSALLTVGKIDTSKVTALSLCFNATGAIRRVEEFDFTAMGNVAQNDLFYTTNNSSVRYWLIKNIGTNSACTSLNFSRVLNWGIPEAAYSQYTSDARQSLIGTLITYSFDRATAEYSTCTITLSANTKALLTTEELEQITAKGYTIA